MLSATLCCPPTIWFSAVITVRYFYRTGKLSILRGAVTQAFSKIRSGYIFIIQYTYLRNMLENANNQ